MKGPARPEGALPSRGSATNGGGLVWLLLAALGCSHGSSSRSQPDAAPGPAPGAASTGGVSVTDPGPATCQTPSPPGADGWTVLRPVGSGVCTARTPLTETCTIHVSPGGNDAHDGFTPARAKRTLQAGYAALRAGSPDQLLLERGGTFDLAQTVIWSKSGASANAPLVLGTYGTAAARPVIRMRGGARIDLSPGYRSPNTLRHLAIVGIHFHAADREPGTAGYAPDGPMSHALFLVGAETTGALLAENILIEDCRFQWFMIPVALMGGPASCGIHIRRSVITDSHSAVADAHGVYAQKVRHLLVEENLIDRINVLRGEPPNRSHTLYLHGDSAGVVVRRNIFARAFEAAMQRSGGIFEDNLVLRTMLGHHHGYVWPNSNVPFVAGGARATIRHNVIMDLGVTGGGGTGIYLGNVRGGLVERNIIVPRMAAPFEHDGIVLDGSAHRENAGVHDLAVRDNVFANVAATVRTVGANTSGVVVEGDRRERSIPRTVSTYLQSLGERDTRWEAFLDRAAKQSRAGWDPRFTAPAVNAHVRGGFGL